MSCKIVSLKKQWSDALVDVSLTVGNNEIVALLGPSGCGKTTALRMIARLEIADSGSIIINGRDVSTAQPRQLGIGMVFQDHALFPHLSVEDNVAFGLAIRGLKTCERKRIARLLLARVGLDRFHNRRIHGLSGGERQRVALARAFAIDPTLVLLDEPLSSVDETLRHRLRSDIRLWLKESGTAAIYVTHDIDEAFAVADRVAVMIDGVVEATGKATELWARPPSAAVAAFLDSGCLFSIDEVHDGGYGVRTPCGFFHFSVPAVYIGSNARLYLYAPSEALRIIPQPDATPATPAAENRIDAMCISRNFSKGTWRCSFSAGSERFTLGFPADRAPIPQERVMFRLDSDQCTVLPYRLDHG